MSDEILATERASEEPRSGSQQRVDGRLTPTQRMLVEDMWRGGGWYAMTEGTPGANNLPSWFRSEPWPTLRALCLKGYVERRFVEVRDGVKVALYRATKSPIAKLCDGGEEA